MRQDPVVEGEFYHVYNRGVDKRSVFVSSDDYNRFKYNLYLSNSTQSFNISDLTKYKKAEDIIFNTVRENELVTIHAYALMPNHFHLLLSPKIEGGISLFMQKLTTAYTMYFNRKNKRSGSLFQGTFKSEHVDSDRYLRYLFSYIHSNPFSIFGDNGKVSIKDMEKVMNYKYSSILDYRKVHRPENVIVSTELFSDELDTEKNIVESFEIWLHYHKNLEVKPQD